MAQNLQAFERRRPSRGELRTEYRNNKSNTIKVILTPAGAVFDSEGFTDPRVERTRHVGMTMTLGRKRGDGSMSMSPSPIPFEQTEKRVSRPGYKTQSALTVRCSCGTSEMLLACFVSVS